MTRFPWASIVLVALLVGAAASAGEPSCCPPSGPWCQRLAPAGGWNRYGGGLVHWWNRCCFPRGGVPDDYCCKPLPPLCWPPYAPWYKAIPYCDTPAPIAGGCKITVAPAPAPRAWEE